MEPLLELLLRSLYKEWSYIKNPKFGSALLYFDIRNEKQSSTFYPVRQMRYAITSVGDLDIPYKK